MESYSSGGIQITKEWKKKKKKVKKRNSGVFFIWQPKEIFKWKENLKKNGLK